MTTTPHDLYQIWRPDQVAECMSGVPEDLQRKLWDQVQRYSPDWNSEVPDSFDNAMVTFWTEFTQPEQTLLNELATREELE